MPDFYHRSIQERDAPLPPTSVFILEGREQYLAAPSYRCHNFSWPGKQNERKRRRGVASGQLTDAEITLPQLQYWRHPPPSWTGGMTRYSEWPRGVLNASSTCPSYIIYHAPRHASRRSSFTSSHNGQWGGNERAWSLLNTSLRS